MSYEKIIAESYGRDRMAEAGFTVYHTGGGCLSWATTFEAPLLGTVEMYLGSEGDIFKSADDPVTFDLIWGDGYMCSEFVTPSNATEATANCLQQWVTERLGKTAAECLDNVTDMLDDLRNGKL